MQSGTRWRGAALVSLLAVAALLGAAATSTARAQTATAAVTLTEFSVSVNPAQASAGQVTFNASNTGRFGHQLVVIRTDLDPRSLPQANNAVDESAVQIVGRMNTIPGGSTGSVSANLAAGRYILICNVPTHYQQGMSTAFTVTAASGSAAPSTQATQAAAASGAGAATQASSAAVTAPRTGTAGLVSSSTPASEAATALLAAGLLLLTARWLTGRRASRAE